MKVRAIDEKGDWVFGLGVQSYKNDIQAVVQLIATHIRSWYLDCFFDMEAGIDWKNLLGNRKTEDMIKLACRREILKIPEVRTVDALWLHLDEERRVTVSYEVTTIYGEYSESVLVL